MADILIRELWEADTGDVIRLPRHWPAEITVKSAEYAGGDSRDGTRYFIWVDWTAPGASGRERYSSLTLIGITSQADRPAYEDGDWEDLRNQLTGGSDCD